MMSDVILGKAGHRLQQGRATSLSLYLAHQRQHQQHLMAQPSPPLVDSGGDDDDDCGPKTFSNTTTGLEVEVPQAVTQRIANHQCARGLQLIQGFVPHAMGSAGGGVAERFRRTNTSACQSTVSAAQAEMTGSS